MRAKWEKEFDRFFKGTEVIGTPAQNLNIAIVKDFVSDLIKRERQLAIQDCIYVVKMYKSQDTICQRIVLKELRSLKDSGQGTEETNA